MLWPLAKIRAWVAYGKKISRQRDFHKWKYIGHDEDGIYLGERKASQYFLRYPVFLDTACKSTDFQIRTTLNMKYSFWRDNMWHSKVDEVFVWVCLKVYFQIFVNGEKIFIRCSYTENEVLRSSSIDTYYIGVVLTFLHLFFKALVISLSERS